MVGRELMYVKVSVNRIKNRVNLKILKVSTMSTKNGFVDAYVDT